MWQIIVTVIITLLIVVFVAQNMHQAQVNFLFKKGFEINTAFLLLISFLLGFTASSIYWCGKYLRERKKKG